MAIHDDPIFRLKINIKKIAQNVSVVTCKVNKKIKIKYIIYRSE